MEVTLIDPEQNPGGVCLYRGCIPSKALLHVARVINESREAEAWGVSFNAPKVDIERLRAWKQKVVATITDGLGQLGSRRKVRHLRGTATFLDQRTLKITGVDGQPNELGFQYAIIASGSLPAVIPSLPKDAEKIWNSRTALDVPTIPKRLLVIGGGYIGLELGTFYAATGSEVTVVEMTAGLLQGVDPDLVRYLQKRAATQFKEILLNTSVLGAVVEGEQVRVTLQGGDGESQRSEVFDRVLVAVGRKPNSSHLDLEKAGVKLAERGFIQVDNQRRTSADSIFAIGDVASEPMLAHKAYYEAKVAVEVIAGKKSVYQPAAIPAVVFTDPEIAWAGMMESEAKAKGIPYQVARMPWAAIGRAVTMDRIDGLTKFLIDPQNERLLGVGLVGTNAGELIAEGVLAMEMAANMTDLSLCIHPHPTLSETYKEAAEVFHGTATHYYRPRKAATGKP
jgi:dihydrolipoamide dehydrogenase